MPKATASPATTQLVKNPNVSITYAPEEQILEIGNHAVKALAKLKSLTVKDAKTLSEANIVISATSLIQDEIIEVRDGLAERVKEAWEPYKSFPLFAGSEINITLSIPLRQNLETEFRRTKQSRANYLAAEEERIRRENLKKQAEQDRINLEAAKNAAKSAQKQGASKDTIKEIKQAVMETPAPVVVSKAAEVAKEAGASVRYSYSAEVTNLKSFLGACLNNAALLATLSKAIPDIEKAFRGMAVDQKELFSYPGITVKKTPIDVGRRA